MACEGLWGEDMLVLPDGSALVRRDGIGCPCGNALFGIWWDGRRYHVQCDRPGCCKPPKGGKLVGSHDCKTDAIKMGAS